MNKIHSSPFTVTALLAGIAITPFVATTATAADLGNSACVVEPVSTRTDFPEAAQQLGQSGIVEARVHVDSQGHVHDVSLSNSSGFGTLDRAAVASIGKHWRFAVTNCSATDLERERVVIVRFERATSPTVFGTISAGASAKGHELRADSRCTASDASSNTTIFACVKDATEESTVARVSTPKSAQ
jgi:TonB family protein